MKTICCLRVLGDLNCVAKVDRNKGFPVSFVTYKKLCLSRSVLLAFLVIIMPLTSSASYLVEYTMDNTTKFGFIGVDEGVKDWHWRDLSQYSEYLNESPWLGFGHGNRCYQLFYFDLTSLTKQLDDGESFLVSDVSFSSSEEDRLQYLGGAEICPVLVDWISGEVDATWDNIEGSGTGVTGHGSAVQTGGRINNSTYSYPIPGQDVDLRFNIMIEDWLNGETPNYGFEVRATANSTSSVDYHNQWILSIRYDIVPEPATATLFALGVMLLRRRNIAQ